jgi:large subunit ribosomal protein L21
MSKLYFFYLKCMSSYAIIQIGSKQVWVEEKKFYDFDKLPLDSGDNFSLNQILLVKQQNSLSIGKPYLDKEYQVEATVLRHLSGPKVRVYKMRSKKKTRKTFGSRRKFTRVLVKSISQKTEQSVACYL